jgi:ATP-dependent Clp protease ATP-binding subunit ClpA
MRAAEQACRNHNHYYLGVGHLLLALLEERDPGIEARMTTRGTNPADVVADVRRALGTGDDRLWDGILITPRVRSVIALAEAGVSEGEFIGPADLLDAIVLEGGGLAAEILTRWGPPGGTPPQGRRPDFSDGNMSSSQRVTG